VAQADACAILVLNKPTSFFNNVDLNTEMNPGVELQIIGDDKTYANCGGCKILNTQHLTLNFEP
jgi:hypothetical protein